MQRQKTGSDLFINLVTKIISNLTPDTRPFIPLAQSEVKTRSGNTEGVWKRDDRVSLNTKTNEQTVLNHFVVFAGHDIRCCDIKPKLIEDFYMYLGGLRSKKGEPICESTKKTYMSSFRSLLNRLGFNGEELFANIRIKTEKAEKRALDKEDVDKLFALINSPELNDSLRKALLLFLFCYSANGMPFIDLAFLKWTDIGKGIIVYYRHKTGVKVTVPINDFMGKVIKLFGQRESKYVFGLLKRLDPAETMKEYLDLRGQYNTALHQIGIMAKLSVTLTSYVARHSWATIAYLSNKPIAFISKALGHTNILTTERYIKSISNKEFLKCSEEVSKVINMDVDLRVLDKIHAI